MNDKHNRIIRRGAIALGSAGIVGDSMPAAEAAKPSRSILSGVMRAGRYYPKPALEATKERTATRMVAVDDTIAAVSSPCC